MVEREIDRARRSFGMFFEIFSQRGSSFAPRAGRPRRHRGRLLSRRCAQPLPTCSRAPCSSPSPTWSTATRRPRSAAASQLARLLGETQSVPGHPHSLGSRQSLAGGVPARGRAQSAGRSRACGRRTDGGGQPDDGGAPRSAARRHLSPLAQGDLRRSRRHPARRTDRPLGHDGVSRPSRRPRADLSAGRRASDRLSARLHPGRDAAPAGLRRGSQQCAPVWRDLYDPRRGHRLPPPLLRRSAVQFRRWSTRSPSSRAARSASTRSPTSYPSAARMRSPSAAAPCGSPPAAAARAAAALPRQRQRLRARFGCARRRSLQPRDHASFQPGCR